MPSRIDRIRIFVASPSDVGAERDAMPSIVNELNHTLAALVADPPILELVRWETHAFPGMGRPQGVINDQIGDYDIFVGILWCRFGTPTGLAASGTEEEFRRAHDSWAQCRKPHILVYFNRASVSPPRSSEAVEQLAKVVEFRNEVSKGGLTWEYDGAEHFKDTVRPHLVDVVGGLLRASNAQRVGGEVFADIPESVDSGGLERIVVTDVSSHDAYYGLRDSLIGARGVLAGPYPSDTWYGGVITFDEPPRPGYDRTCTFYRVRVVRETE